MIKVILPDKNPNEYVAYHISQLNKFWAVEIGVCLASIRRQSYFVFFSLSLSLSRDQIIVFVCACFYVSFIGKVNILEFTYARILIVYF